ncbi:MAG: helix-turn-helix transcriptional regulator [Thermoleophilaceae bacterium]|nr:helix-turn-helix transcriptional regulator [Thermoleophilaceae bacterium]
MARPREFDETLAIGAAAAVFRRHGYAATSIAQIVQATGVHRGSLYATFESKRGLFLRVLEYASSGGLSADEQLDLLLTALVELPPADRVLRERIELLMFSTQTTARQLGQRLLDQARVRDLSERGGDLA